MSLAGDGGGGGGSSASLPTDANEFVDVETTSMGLAETPKGGSANSSGGGGDEDGEEPADEDEDMTRQTSALSSRLELCVVVLSMINWRAQPKAPGWCRRRVAEERRKVARKR